MSLDKAIGGYPQLELNNYKTTYHDNAYHTNTGRNCFELILASNSYKKVFIPYYTCDVLLEPLRKLNLEYSFYHLNESFLPIEPLNIGGDDILLYTNYFGICDDNIRIITKSYQNVIIDNSQAFYSMPLEGISTFYSPRKFFGLPDGGQVYNKNIESIYNDLEIDVSAERCSHLLTRIDQNAEKGYEAFKENDLALSNLPPAKMSKLTFALMQNIDYHKVKRIRKENFDFLHAHLGSKNDLSFFLETKGWDTPMVYPFLQRGNEKLRLKLNQARIYTAIYWSNVIGWINKIDDTINETNWVKNLVPLPINQNLTPQDLHKITEIINGQ